MDLPDSDRGDFSCRRAVNSSSFLKLIDYMAYVGYMDLTVHSPQKGH